MPVVWVTVVGAAPAGSSWLGPRERRVEETLHRPWRRADWRAGRWAAKRLLPGLEPHLVEVLADRDGAPRLHVGSDPMEEGVSDSGLGPRGAFGSTVALSISHRAGFAAAALGPAGELGLDLEREEPRSRRFVEDFFTRSEAIRHEAEAPERRDLFAALTWSAKEGLLKCARTGLSRDTRTVTVELDDLEPGQGWARFQGQDLERGARFDGWWRRGPKRLLLTVVAPAGGALSSHPPLLVGPPAVDLGRSGG